MRPSPTYRLLDHLIAEGVDVFVAERRARRRSWRRIAQDLYEATGVDITYETVRSWFQEANDGTEAA